MSRPPGPYQTVDQVRCFLTELLAGRAAEEVLLGIVCTGAGDGSDSDLARATGLAAAAIGSYGLLPDAGAVWLTGPDPDEAARTVRKHAGLAAHVRILLDQAHDAALHLVNEHRACVEAVADKLLHQRILTGEEIAATARTAAAQASDPSGARSPVVPAKPPSRDGNVGPSTARDAASSHDSPSPAHPSI